MEFLLQKCLLSSPLHFICLLSKSVYLLVVGAAKRVIFFLKMFENLVLSKHMEDEAETWHTCLGYYPLQKICFYSGRIRTLVVMAT